MATLYGKGLSLFLIPKSCTIETTSYTRIKQCNCRFVRDRKCTRHNWCVLWEFSERGKIDPSLLNLHHLLLAFVLVGILVGVLTRKRFLGLGTILGKV